MTVSISFIYTGVNFNTQPSTLHENYGRQSIYKQLLPALPCSPSPPHPASAITHPQHGAGAAGGEGTSQPRGIDLRLFQMCPCPLGAGESFLTALNTPRMGCCSSGWLQCHPYWELPHASACAGLQHRLLGTQGHRGVLNTGRPHGFVTEPCRQGTTSSIPKELS